MCSTHFRRMNVCETMRTKLPVSMSVDRAWNDNARILRFANAPDIFGGVRRIADQRELEGGLDALKRLAHQHRVIFRLHAAHVKEVLTRLELKGLENLRSLDGSHLGAIGN